MASAVPPEDLREEDVLPWLERRLNRVPDSFDLYEEGKRLFQDGVYGPAARVLAVYVDSPGSEKPGRHLLGHACFMSGDLAGAQRHLAEVANEGFDDDWQALVEAALEQEAREREAATRRAVDALCGGGDGRGPTKERQSLEKRVSVVSSTAAGTQS